MNTKIQEAENVLLHTYARYPIVFDKGEGVHLYDANGKKYLDFAAGIAVCALGYGNKTFTDRIKQQVDKIMHTSNYFYNEPAIYAAQKLLEATGMERVFFTNSGTEAVEGALKMARKYAHEKYGEAKCGIVAMNRGFHGRSMGALSVTGTAAYREPFEPLVGGVTFAEYNDYDSVKALVNENTCAVIVEVVQGEGGIHVADQSFLEGVRNLCNEKDALLIFDEVQCGMGRTGKMFAYQHYGVTPDIVTCAKGLGGGVPVGAFAARGKACEALQPGNHGTTYGGNPMATEAVGAVFDIMESEHVLDNVNCVGTYLAGQLDELVRTNANVLERRGIGLMQGVVLHTPVGEAVQKSLEKGLIVISAAGNVLRIVPPLVVTEKDVDEAMAILKSII